MCTGHGVLGSVEIMWRINGMSGYGHAVLDRTGVWVHYGVYSKEFLVGAELLFCLTELKGGFIIPQDRRWAVFKNFECNSINWEVFREA